MSEMREFESIFFLLNKYKIFMNEWTLVRERVKVNKNKINWRQQKIKTNDNYTQFTKQDTLQYSIVNRINLRKNNEKPWTINYKKRGKLLASWVDLHF